MFQKIKSFLFENKTTRQTVAKNTIWLSISNFGGRLIKAAVILYGARALGTAEWGIFSYALTLSGFLALFMDPGINGILMRDAAKSSEADRRTLFSTTLAIKICLLAIGFLIIFFVAPFFSILPGAKALLPIVAFILMFDTLRDFMSSVVRAMEKMELEAGIYIATNIGIVVFGFAFLIASPTAQSFGWGYVAGDLNGVVISILILRSYFKKIASFFSRTLVLPILKSAWPFAISGALGLLFTNTDILIISWMRTASDVGIYSAAIRIIQILYLIPMVLQYSTLPLFSRLAKTDAARFRGALERTLVLVFFASIPLSFGGMILAPDIMQLLFGTPYRSGGASFAFLAATLFFDFGATIVINALFAYERQKSLIVSSALGGATNVILDLALIPLFGITGSAVATLVAQAVNNGYLWHAMKKVNRFTVFSRLKKICAAGIAMAAITLGLLYAHVNVAVNIILSAAAYFGILYAWKEPILAEIGEIIMPRNRISAPAETQ